MVEHSVSNPIANSVTNSVQNFKTTLEPLPLWAWPTALSLDAPAVAVAWQWLFAHAFGIELTAHHVLGLGISVWLIYVADRLLDSFKLDLRRPHTYRHALVAHHRHVFALLWVAGLGLDGALVLAGLSLADLALGLAALGAVAWYGLGIHLPKSGKAVFTKEVQVGFVFALGATLPVWTRAPGAALLVGALLFAALCSLNCLLIAVWERSADAAQGQASLALAWPPLKTLLAPALLTLSLLAFATSVWLPPLVSVTVGSSALLLWLLAHFQNALPEELLRVLVDAALLTPFVYLLFRG